MPLNPSVISSTPCCLAAMRRNRWYCARRGYHFHKRSLVSPVTVSGFEWPELKEAKSSFSVHFTPCQVRNSYQGEKLKKKRKEKKTKKKKTKERRKKK